MASDDTPAMEPLLPMHTHAAASAAAASPPDGYGGRFSRDADLSKSPKLREKYFKQLGYTPLVFRVSLV
jgi:hypothetical protein